MAIVQLKRGRQTWTLEQPSAQEVEAELRAALGPVIDRMQAEADAIIANEVLPNWPVKTGTSRAAWTTGLRVDEAKYLLEVVLINAARTKRGQAYVRHIMSAKVGKKEDATRIRSPLAAHGRKPARTARARLWREIPAMLARKVGEIYDKHGA